MEGYNDYSGLGATPFAIEKEEVLENNVRRIVQVVSNR
jgi:hypothetical protein